MPASPYLAPDFYAKALARGRHRDIVGGRWDETGRIQMQCLFSEGLRPQHRLLDIGCGSLRLGCKAVPWLLPNHYWGTDASVALMLRGWQEELAAKDRLPLSHLVQDADFAFPGIPPDIDYALAFGVFAHLPSVHLGAAMASVRQRFPGLQRLLFTVFLAPDGHAGPLRQPDGVVTHPDRPPYHRHGTDVLSDARRSGFDASMRDTILPRGQVLWVATPGQP